MKKMLVIDGNSILNRAYFGIRPLTNKDGLYTHAVYGMANIIHRHVEALKPDYCAVAFDMRAPTFRHKMYDGYKANRKGMPEELAVQLPYAKRCMEYLGYKVIEKEGYEADDILGTLSNSCGSEGVHAYVLTGDRDSLQLINENVSVLLVKTKETLEYTGDVFKEHYGVSPDAFVDVKALMGDSSDNIPGVAGIGEKTALKLIADFGDMDKLYEQFEASALSASVKAKLSAGKDMAYLSRDLARIDINAPIGICVGDCEYKGIKKRELRELFVELEFFALIKKFGLDGIEDCEHAAEKKACKPEREENGVGFGENVCVLLLDGEQATVLDGECETVTDIDGALKMLSGKSIICHDYKSIYKELAARGQTVVPCAFDTMLAAYVLDSTRGKYTLSDLCGAYLGDTEDTSARAVKKLAQALCELVENEECGALLYDMEIPLAAVLADMEMTGFCIDKAGIEQYGRELSEAAEALKERVFVQAGQEFNLNSPKQLGEVLFEKMGLPAPKKTKTGYSTDAATLQKLAADHEIISDILEYRQMTKLKSTYADGLARAADESGRIHTLLNQTGTATGRLSSAEPNLQNIPVRTEEGRRFRKYFVAGDGDYCLIDADYSQIELRLLAHISGDENMKNAFLSGEDIHTMTACRVFGISPSEVTVEQRKRAKAVNFGIVYGIGEHSLSEDLHISRAEAKKYIESYLAGFPKVSEYLDGIKNQAREDGYVSTAFGRRRYIPELTASNKNIQHFGERVAMNSPIQGTAADVIKIAMVKTARALAESGLDACLVLQVHDELILQSHKSCAQQVKKILVDCMEGAVSFDVPLSVEANIGDNWYDAK